MSQESKTYGIWSVSTEGDCEGRSIRNLGIFEGTIADIALFLANRCYYSLNFKKCEIQKPSAPTKNKTNVTIEGVDRRQLISDINEDNKDITASEGDYYNSVSIQLKNAISPEELKKAKMLSDIQAKLTPEEKKLLGIG